MSSRLRIVARTNNVGVDRDVQLLVDTLSASGEHPAFSHYRSISPLRRVFGRRDPDETIIFLERVTARWLRSAGRYMLIPNQERFARRLVPLLRRIDYVLCKTRHAEQIFRAHHPSVRYVGFTSVDRRIPEVAPDFGRFLHLAGGSSLKGTNTLLEVWRRHPEWPVLTLVQHRREGAQKPMPPNVERIDRYLPDAELRALQNTCGVHLCPSLSEGWGHYIVEAMSCAAVVLTTDAPPMNELVQPDRGVLVPHYRSEPRKLGFNFFVDPDVLERSIAELIGASSQSEAGLGRSARSWFEQNDAAFRRNLPQVLGELLDRPVG